MAKMNEDELAQYVLKRHNVLEGKRSEWLSLWQDLAKYCMPRKAEITGQHYVSSPTSHREDVLFDSTMVQSNIVLSNGCMSSLTPSDSRWFSFDPPAHLKGNDVIEQYFRHSTEIAMLELANSNFYTTIHEAYLDRGCFGTAVVYCEEGRRSLLNFSKFDVGTFCIAEDDEGYIDTLSRNFTLTSRQAVQWFGLDMVSDQIRTDFESGEADKMEREYTFIHQIFPRAADDIELDPKSGKPFADAANMPVASVYVEKDKKKVVRISGFVELPFFATRYLRWLSRYAYGWSPAWMALAEARQLNFLQKQMDALAELAAFPRFLIPDTHEGEVDFRAAGVTYFDSANPGSIPREWATEGKYDVGLERIQEKQKSIKEAFHVDLFQMFQNLERPQMTAREVIERSSEKLMQFSPTFSRMTTEFFTPMLKRVWAMLSRSGAMPPPPMELIQQTPDGELIIPAPAIVYSSRIALAVKQLENASLLNTFEAWLPTYEVHPETFDNLHWDESFRDSVRNSGLPARWLVPKDIVEKIRENRAAQQEKMRQQQEMATMAEAAGKAGSIKEDSVVGGMLKQAGVIPGSNGQRAPSGSTRR